MTRALTPADAPREILTLADVGEWLAVSAKTVIKLVETDKLPGFRLGRQWRFRREDVQAWLDAKGKKVA